MLRVPSSTLPYLTTAHLGTPILASNTATTVSNLED